MKFSIRVLFVGVLSVYSLSCFADTCSYIFPSKNIKIDNDVEAELSIRLEKGECEKTMVSMRIHNVSKASKKQLYVVDNTLGSFFGNRAQNLTDATAKALIDELLNEIDKPKAAGDFDSRFKCLPLIPDIYLDKLKKNKRNMLSYRWRSNEIRYLAYIEEIEQIVVIAQCSRI